MVARPDQGLDANLAGSRRIWSLDRDIVDVDRLFWPLAILSFGESAASRVDGVVTSTGAPTRVGYLLGRRRLSRA